MKKVLIKQSIAGHEFSYKPGDIAELIDELASAWVQSGVAVWAPKEKPKAETAVAPKPETPEAPKAVDAKVEETKKGE